MQRLERLINLVAALLDASRPLSRREIQERVPGYEGTGESTRRAFERDKESLRAMGIPLTVEPLDPTSPDGGEGYRIPRERYALPDPGLAPDELVALHVAASAVRIEGGAGPETIWKLGGSPVPAPDTGGLAALSGSEHLPALFEAVSERRTVRFRYRDAWRTAEPHRLSYRNGFWYLAGHDRDRGEERSFRLDRLQSAPEVGPPGAFERPRRPAATPPALPWEMGDEEAVVARLLVDADQADWVVERIGEQAVERRLDGGAVILALHVTNRDAFRSFVLGFLDHAEVLGPPELREATRSWLAEMAGMR